MPRFWYNSNTSSPQDAVRNEVEINAVVAYLFANAEKHEFAVKNPPRGDAKSGEQIVKSIGCQGCHVVGEGTREAAGPRRTFGQPLENIGNKTTYEWIFNWVRDPKHYSPNTYMPNLRLTDAQVADVATYLMTLKQGGGDAAKATFDRQRRRQRAPRLLQGGHAARGRESRSWRSSIPGARQVALGQRVISRYGCFSCHDIKGFEKAQSIGTDLSEEGSKLVTRLDFAFITEHPAHVEDRVVPREAARSAHLRHGTACLQPLDKLRMPNFEFTDVEVRTVS